MKSIQKKLIRHIGRSWFVYVPIHANEQLSEAIMRGRGEACASVNAFLKAKRGWREGDVHYLHGDATEYCRVNLPTKDVAVQFFLKFTPEPVDISPPEIQGHEFPPSTRLKLWRVSEGYSCGYWTERNGAGKFCAFFTDRHRDRHQTRSSTIKRDVIDWSRNMAIGTGE